jgi:hypothetical protein
MLVSRLTKTPLTLEEIAPGRSFPRGLQQVLDWALQRNPDQRAPSCAAFAKAMRDALSAAGIAPAATRSTAAPPPPARRGQEEVPATRVADAGMGVPADARVQGGRPGANRRKLVVGLVVATLVLSSGLGAWALLNQRDRDVGNESNGVRGDTNTALLPIPPSTSIDSVPVSRVDSHRVVTNPVKDSTSNVTNPGPAPRPDPPPAPVVDSSAIERLVDAASNVTLDARTLTAIRDSALIGLQQASLPVNRMRAAFAAATAMYQLKEFVEGLRMARQALSICIEYQGAQRCRGYQGLVDQFPNRTP